MLEAAGLLWLEFGTSGIARHWFEISGIAKGVQGVAVAPGYKLPGGQLLGPILEAVGQATCQGPNQDRRGGSNLLPLAPGAWGSRIDAGKKQWSKRQKQHDTVFTSASCKGLGF